MTIQTILTRHAGTSPASTLNAVATSLMTVAALLTIMATPATAQEEELPPGIVVDVTPQGWLNPPNAPIEGALPGSMRQQVIIDTYIARDSAFVARPDSFGESVLPRGRGPNLNLRTID